MNRLRRQALAAGYVVALLVTLLSLVTAFGYVGAWEVVAAAVLAVPVTAVGARMVRAGLAAGVDPVDPADTGAAAAG